MYVASVVASRTGLSQTDAEKRVNDIITQAKAAVPNFYNVTIRIANVAARLTVLGLRLSDELGPSTAP